uniref:Uncharacterized protein n=1 Tax=Triticum urartu TaxID=4572 RepID=A0A8R7Q3B1_TRIUA
MGAPPTPAIPPPSSPFEAEDRLTPQLFSTYDLGLGREAGSSRWGGGAGDGREADGGGSIEAGGWSSEARALGVVHIDGWRRGRRGAQGAAGGERWGFHLLSSNRDSCDLATGARSTGVWGGGRDVGPRPNSKPSLADKTRAIV